MIADGPKMVIWKNPIGYRRLKGITRRFIHLGRIPHAPNSTPLGLRHYGLTPAVRMPHCQDFVFVSDGTGLKISNAGECRIFRYGDTDTQRRKHLVVGIPVNVQPTKGIGIEVRMEGEGHSESQIVAAHVRGAPEQGNWVRKFFGDRAYGTNGMFIAAHEVGTDH